MEWLSAWLEDISLCPKGVNHRAHAVSDPQAMLSRLGTFLSIFYCTGFDHDWHDAKLGSKWNFLFRESVAMDTRVETVLFWPGVIEMTNYCWNSLPFQREKLCSFLVYEILIQ